MWQPQKLLLNLEYTKNMALLYLSATLPIFLLSKKFKVRKWDMCKIISQVPTFWDNIQYHPDTILNIGTYHMNCSSLM